MSDTQGPEVMVDETDVDKVEETEELDEFKASFGDPSEVPEPTSGKAKKLKGSKDAGEKTQVVTPGSSPPKTKVAAINAMMTKLHSMKKEDLLAMHSRMMTEDDESESDPADDEDKINIREVPQIESSDIDLSADISALFKDEDLTEDFKTKATTIFEAAVVSKVNEHLSVITTDLDAEIEAEKLAIENDMQQKVDSYLDYVVEEWTKENEVAIERGLKSELTEDFLRGLHNLFAEHYIDIPEDKVDVVEELAQKVEELEGDLNKEIEKNVELSKTISESDKDSVIRNVTSDMADTEVEKLRSLASGIDYENSESYEEKLSIIKESYFARDGEKPLTSVIESDDGQVELDEEESKTTGAMAVYLNAISRTVKN
jgi:hypothetical protein